MLPNNLGFIGPSNAQSSNFRGLFGMQGTTSIDQNSRPVITAMQARGDHFGRQGTMSIDQNFRPIMAMSFRADLFGRKQGSTSIDQNLQPVVMAVHAVSARSLCGRKMKKLVEERLTSIHYDLHKGWSSTLERGRPQLTWTALDEEASPVRNNCPGPFRYLAEESCRNFRREGFPRGKELPIGSVRGNGDIEGTTIVQETDRLPKGKNRLPEGNNGEKSTVPTASRRVWRKHNSQVGHEGANRDIPSAGTMKEAIAILKNSEQQGIIIDSYTLMEILKRCLEQKDLIAARQVHDCIIRSGMDKNPYVATSLLNVYIRCGKLEDARRVFDGLEKKTFVTWRSMIVGYAKSNHAEDALEVFNRMRQAGAEPDEVTCLSILKACTSPLALKWGKDVHAYGRNAGLESHMRVGTAIVQMYAKCGCITEARRVFDELPSRDVISWSVIIGAYAESGCGLEAYRLFLQMKREGFVPNALTYVNLLNPSASAGALEWVKKVHSHARKAGLDSDLLVANVLVHMYAKSGGIDDARRIFDRLEKRDVVTWTMMIGAYAESGCGFEAYRLFLQMKREGCKPDATTFVTILNAAASEGALEWVKEVHSDALKAGLESDLRVGNVLVHMYAKSGSIDDARLIFDRMEKRDVVTWTAMIGGLAEHGCGHEALELFRKMNTDGVKPDRTTFVALLSACCHAGLVDDGRRLFSAMTQDYGIERTVVHYTCMVDLFGRAGRLEEAKIFIGDMPIEPDAVTWGALLGACRTYGNVELGELAFKELQKLEPKQESAYVLLSNIYAAAGKWEKVSFMRTMMQDRGIRKEPGRSWVEIGDKIHKFVVGDTSHPEEKAIYTELNKLTEKLKAEGYIPDTQLVLQNIDEEDKELALCSHSEKLAIVYGLMHTAPGKQIRIYKNLRVCSDCHSATKVISKVTGREIIARDANRFHHFKDGMCSCGDYW